MESMAIYGENGKTKIQKIKYNTANQINKIKANITRKWMLIIGREILIN